MNYNAHLAAAYGNVPTIEGMTCFSTDVDLESYKPERGRLTPNATSGFGMKLIKY